MDAIKSDAVIVSQSKEIAELKGRIGELQKAIRSGKYDRTLHHCAIAWINAKRIKADRLKKYRALRVNVLSDVNTADNYNLANHIIHESDEYREMLSASRHLVIAENKLVEAVEDHINNTAYSMEG